MSQKDIEGKQEEEVKPTNSDEPTKKSEKPSVDLDKIVKENELLREMQSKQDKKISELSENLTKYQGAFKAIAGGEGEEEQKGLTPEDVLAKVNEVKAEISIEKGQIVADQVINALDDVSEEFKNLLVRKVEKARVPADQVENIIASELEDLKTVFGDKIKPRQADNSPEGARSRANVRVSTNKDARAILERLKNSN